ncbi:hypothetical protein GF369_02760 [Candidatus Peregrinibacteria bacterium]|nr:hypothetical protein [Candidatus Peregrinibacteria bacterium]
MKTSHVLTTLAVVAALTIVNVAAANQGAMQPQGEQKGKLEEVRQAVENNDYDAWAELTQDHPRAAELFGNITADNFHLLNEMHQAKQNGDMEKAKELADQLGFQPGPKNKNMNKGKFRMREEVQTALENRDYNAWHEAITPPVLDYINEENFDTFVDMHEAIQSKDMETANSLREQLGLPERQAPQNGQGLKMRQQ